MMQGYFSLDYIAMTDEEYSQLQAGLKQYFIYWVEINRTTQKVLYFGILRVPSLLNDTLDDEGNVIAPGLLKIFAARNIDILGAWNKDGLYYGQYNVIDEPAVYDDHTGELVTPAVISLQGTALYPLQTAKYLELMPNRVEYSKDEEPIKIYDGPYDKPVDLHRFMGWESPKTGF